MLVTSMHGITMALALAQYAGADDLPKASIVALLGQVP